MKYTQNIIEDVKADIFNKAVARYKGANISIEIDFKNELFIFMSDTHTLEFCFEDAIIKIDGKIKRKLGTGFQYTCCHKTPKGYISKKLIGVLIEDDNDITIDEAIEIMKFNTDAIKNTFDPFWHQHQAESRSASAWVYIALNHMQPDCR